MISHTFAICAYGDSVYLEACIRSLKKQRVPSKVILCTSTPSPFLEKMAEKYGIPMYVRDGESDIQADWNFAYETADSRLVTIAHQDDMYHKAYGETVQKCWKRYPDTTVMTTDAVIVKHGRLQKPDKVEMVKKLLRLPLRIPALNHLQMVKKSALCFGNPVMCPSCTYDKEALGAPLFQSELRYALDWDTMVDLAERPGRFICVERPLLYYRIHDGATTKGCIRDHRREREEAAMYGRFWPEWLVQMLMRFYRKAYDSYES